MADIDGVEGFRFAGVEHFKQRNQPSGCDIVANSKGCKTCDTGARKGELTQPLAIADLNLPGRGNDGRLALLAKRPAIDDARIAEAKAIVPFEVGNGARLTAAFEIGRRGNDGERSRTEFARDEAGRLQRPGADGNVGTLRQEIDHGVCLDDIERDARMKGQKRGQHGREDVVEVGGAGVEANAADRLLSAPRRALGVFDIRKNTRRALVERTAFRRKLQLPRRSVEKPCAQSGFKACDQFADRRWRQAGRARCRGEAAEFNDAHEHVHFTRSIDVGSCHDELISHLVFLFSFYFISRRTSMFRVEASLILTRHAGRTARPDDRSLRHRRHRIRLQNSNLRVERIMPHLSPSASDYKRQVRSALHAAAFAFAATFPAPSAALAGDQSWVGTWMASPQPIWGSEFPFPTKIPASVKDQTFRQVVRVSLGGARIRLVFSNAYGDKPMRIGGASVGIAGKGNALETGTLREITFGGKGDIVVPPGAPVVSDPVNIAFDEQGKLGISLYLPDETPLTTFHWDGRQTAWFGKGDQTEADSFTATRTTDARVFLSDVLVDAPNEGAVVVIGDSITDGNGAAVDADTRWPDFLAKRLAPQRIAVLNAGISGGRLLQDKMGVNVAARLKRDVLSQPNVKAAIVLIGINDISWPGTDFAPDQTLPSAEEMIAGYKQLIALAEANKIRLIGATLPPFEGALSGTPLGNYYHTDKDALRQEINRWIRESGAFDAIIDFDVVLRDPDHPARIDPAFDSGDHLHPGDAGNRAMADALDLDALLGR